MTPSIKMLFRNGVFLAFSGAAALCLNAQQVEAPAPLPLPVRTQRIELREGWNAVWLEVDPVNPDADQVFAGMPIDVCARYFRPVSSMEFIRNPNEGPFKSEGWGVWYAASRDEAEVRTLDQVQGPAAYLIHAKQATTWTVSGKVRFRPYEWKHDSFTLAGFPVEEASPPTFDEFFAGSEGRVGSKIYRLVEGRWQRIAGTSSIRAGEACWVFASGDSNYQGPLTISLNGSVLDFPVAADSAGISYQNTGSTACNPSVELVDGGTAGLPLTRLTPDFSSLSAAQGAVSGQLPSLEKGVGDTLRLAVRRGMMTAAHQTALVKISNGEGTLWWVPLRAAR